jgi:hypothetical protein
MPELQWQINNKKNWSKISFKCVIFLSEILQKLGVFPK